MGRKLLVTGAAGGMGRAVCERLSSEGYTVIGLDRALPDRDSVPERETGGAGIVDCYAVDLCSEEEVTLAFEKIRNKYGELYAIVHLAGMYDLGSLVEMDGERLKRIFDVNFFAVCRVNRVFLPMLTEGGRIIITSSELAPLDPLPFTGLYGVTKSAVEKYAFSLRMELNLLGYKVSVLRPGAVRTAMIGASTDRLTEFCEGTSLYSCNAKRFRKIVDSVETRNIPPEKIANRVFKILKVKRPKYIYNVNRNLLLKLLSVLPARLQVGIISLILKR